MDPVAPSATSAMTEVYASTRPRPRWQSEISSRASLKATEAAGAVLDRNLCFAVRSHLSSSMDAEVHYLDSQLQPVLDKPVSDSDLWSLLAHEGQSIVHLVLYMVPQTGKLLPSSRREGVTNDDDML